MGHFAVVRDQPAAQVDAARRLQAAVAAHAMLVQDRLDVAEEAYRPVAPRRRHGDRRLAGQGQRVPGLFLQRRDAPGLVTADAGPALAALKADEAPHPPQFHAVLVQQLKIHGRVGGHAEVSTAVGLDRHVAQDPDGRPIRQVLPLRAGTAVTMILAITMAAERVVVRPADGLGDPQVPDARRVDAVAAVSDIADRAHGVVHRRVRHVRQYRRLGTRPQGDREPAGNRRIAVDQLLVAKHVDQVQPVAVGNGGRGAVGVVHQEDLSDNAQGVP